MLVSKPARKAIKEGTQPLDVFFSPKTVAVIGATETVGSVGRTILWNLVSNPFGGTVFPINPKRPSVLGVKAYKHISEVPEEVDLAVIVTPASSVPGVIHDCAEEGVKAAIVISAGFKEIGPAGIELERQILVEARRGNMRIIGPNCLGVMSPLTGLNATFAAAIARPGNVGFISQSGALCTAVLDWSLREMVGFSAFISHRLYVGRGLGRSDLLSGQRSAHPQHCHLHGNHRRRARLPLRRARSGAQQAHHRHQGRAQRGRRQGRGVPHRLPGRAATKCWRPPSGAAACCA